MEDQQSSTDKNRPLKVGRDILPGHEKKKVGTKDVRTYDPDGWIDVDRYLPEDYDLVKVKLHNGNLRQAWMQKERWVSVGVKSTDKVTHWKALMYDEKNLP